VYGAGLALAFAGQRKKATGLADDLARRFPEDTAVLLSYLPTLRAQLALGDGDPVRALGLLQVAAPHELWTPPSSLHGSFGSLYPIYVRGEAYLATHNGAAAAAEFEKILQHRGITVSDPIAPLATLQLGRAYLMAGQRERAKLKYQRFLTLWVDADPNIPILKQAKMEYGKLI
jgi:hypothetical protein